MKGEVVLFVSFFNYVPIEYIPVIFDDTLAAKRLHFNPKSALRRMIMDGALSCHTYCNTIFIYLWAEEKVTSYWLAINYQIDQLHDWWKIIGINPCNVMQTAARKWCVFPFRRKIVIIFLETTCEIISVTKAKSNDNFIIYFLQHIDLLSSGHVIYIFTK